MKILILYLAGINIAGFISYGVDKLKARIKRKNKACRRIPEKVLLGLAIAGGSVGSYIGMYVFHHKTKKPRFYIGVPVIILLQVVAGWCLWSFFFQK